MIHYQHYWLRSSICYKVLKISNTDFYMLHDHFYLAVPLKTVDVPFIREELRHRIVCIFGPPEKRIVDAKL